MKLVFIRHGQTVWNLEERLQGWRDSPLTSAAVAQIEKMALPDLKSPMLVSSHLGRAVQTAQLIAKRIGVEALQDSRLRERGFGLLEGERIGKNPTLAGHWAAYKQRYQLPLTALPHVEPEQVFETRIRQFLSYLAVERPSPEVIIISHGEWIRAALNILQGEASWHIGQGVPDNLQAVTLTLNPTKTCHHLPTRSLVEQALD